MQAQCASVAEGDTSGFGMTVRLVVVAAALFALLWLAIDTNPFHLAPPAVRPVSALSPTTTIPRLGPNTPRHSPLRRTRLRRRRHRGRPMTSDDFESEFERWRAIDPLAHEHLLSIFDLLKTSGQLGPAGLRARLRRTGVPAHGRGTSEDPRVPDQGRIVRSSLLRPNGSSRAMSRADDVPFSAARHEWPRRVRPASRARPR